MLQYLSKLIFASELAVNSDILGNQAAVNTTSDFIVTGYWENYAVATNPGPGKPTDASYYENDFKSFNQIHYAFLSLDAKPNPDNPNDGKWDHVCIRDTDSLDCVINDVNWPAVWPNPDAWLAGKVEGTYNACHQNGKKFIWTIGGEADLRGGLNIEDVEAFTD